MRGRVVARLRDVAIVLIAFLALVVLFQLVNALADWLGLGANSRPLTFLFATVAIFFVFWRLAIRRERRLRRLIWENRCLACEYDLTGNTSGLCPECGIPIPRQFQLVCEECGESVALPREAMGSVQLCPRCGKPGEVPKYSRSE